VTRTTQVRTPHLPWSNTNLATATGVIVWIAMDAGSPRRRSPPSRWGQRHDLRPGGDHPLRWLGQRPGRHLHRAICTVVVWFAWNFLSKVRPFSKVDDALGVIYTHGMAGLLGGLLLGIFADPGMIQYPCGGGLGPADLCATSTACVPFSVSGLIYTGSAHQLWEQFERRSGSSSGPPSSPSSS